MIDIIWDSCRSTYFDELSYLEIAEWSSSTLVRFVVAAFTWSAAMCEKATLS